MNNQRAMAIAQARYDSLTPDDFIDHRREQRLETARQCAWHDFWTDGEIKLDPATRRPDGVMRTGPATFDWDDVKEWMVSEGWQYIHAHIRAGRTTGQSILLTGEDINQETDRFIERWINESVNEEYGQAEPDYDWESQ